MSQIDLYLFFKSLISINFDLTYSLSFTPIELDEAIIGLSQLQSRLVKLAELEKSCDILADEIEKTRRRVNAIEYIMIPNLKDTIKLRYFLPGLLIAVSIHSLYNHFILPPLFNTLTQVLALPLIMLAIFSYSENAMSKWLQSGLDSDVKTLEFLKSGEFSQSKQGRYIAGLRSIFPGEVVLDILCYLRLYLELSIRAKGLLMIRETGMNIEVDNDIKERFEELAYLEQSIGKSGKAVLKPFLAKSQRELWQIYFLDTQQ